MGTKLLVKLILRLLAPAAAVALVVVVLVRLELIENPLRSVAEELGLINRTKLAASAVLLEELRSIYRLNTVEYIYRTVFPFDYMPETTDYADIMESIRTSSGPANEALTDDQRMYLDALNIAEEVGLGEEEFLVLTVRVAAGFDLEGTVQEGTPHGGATISRDDETGRRTARVSIPPAAVTDVVIEDVDPQTYSYPDVGMDAEQWREVAGFVAEYIEARTVEEGILEAAGENARELTRNLLIAAGIDHVTFANERNNSANSEEGL